MNECLMLLSLKVTEELGDICNASTIRDRETIAERFKHEGESFLTITLPQFAKDFERSLEREEVSRDLFRNFPFKAGLPKFLGEFLDKVFDRNTGWLLSEPDPEAIRAVRQICLLHSKILLPCTPAREKAALEGFVECESQVRSADALRTEEQKADFAYYADLLFRDLFLSMENDLFSDNERRFLTPKHGPGKTADKLSGNAKWNQHVWTDRLERLFPVGDYALPGYQYSDELGTFTWNEPGEELPVKVVLVPKTPKTPRIIAIEPTCMQYMQQGILRLFLEKFRESDFLTSFIGFDDQEPNQLMAKEGSKRNPYFDPAILSLATLDLSEASDRVSNEHVRLLFQRHSFLAEAFDATRSRKARVPGYGEIHLAKYASMGSALCFPVEAMVFLTVIFSAIGKKLNRRLSRKDLRSFLGAVRVYGDDLIVPKYHAVDVIEQLELFGFRVNSNKSFWNGSFRESCGKEYYDGYDVSVVKNRRVFPKSRVDAQELLSIVAMRNLFYEQGLWATARWLDERITDIIPFPIVEATSVGIGRTSFLPYMGERMCDSLHRPLVRAARAVGRPPISKIDGWQALLKWFLKEGEDPFEEGSYERQGRPAAVYIKVHWLQPF